MLGITRFMDWEAVPTKSVEESRREAICRACEHMIGGLRCGNLNCGCPKSANRIEPWKNLPRCEKWVQSPMS